MKRYLTREEYARSEDMDNYFRVPADTRDLNYAGYLEEGKEEITESKEYNSRNTHQLSIEEIKEILLQLDYVKEELKRFKSRRANVVTGG